MENETVDNVEVAKQTDAEILEALLTCKSVYAAAARAGVSTSTVYARLRDPSFRVKYAQLQSDQLDAVASGLRRLAQLATAELEEILTGPNTSTKDRLSAIKIALSAGAHYDAITIGKD